MKKLYLLLSMVCLQTMVFSQASKQDLFKNFSQQKNARVSSTSAPIQEEDFGPAPQYGQATVFQNHLVSEIRKITIDAAGYIYAAGEFSEILQVEDVSLSDKAKRTIFLGKFSPSGELIWLQQITKHLEGFPTTAVHHVEVNTEGVFISGLLTDGQIQIGETSLTATSNEPSSFIASINPVDGTTNWAHTSAARTIQWEIMPFGSTPSDFTLSPSGIFYLANEQELHELSYTGALQKTHSFPGEAKFAQVKSLNDKLIFSGNLSWESSFGADYLFSTTYYNEQFFVAQYDPALQQFDWASSHNQEYDLPNTPYISGIFNIEVINNEIFIAGYFSSGSVLSWQGSALEGTNPGYSEAPFIAKLSADGMLSWMQALTGNGRTFHANQTGSGNLLAFLPSENTLQEFGADGTHLGSYPYSLGKGFLKKGNALIASGAENYAFSLKKLTGTTFETNSWSVSDEKMGGYSKLSSLEMDKNGNLYHLGQISGKTNILGHPSTTDGLIISKTTATGELEWVQEIENAINHSLGKHLVLNEEEGSLYVSGYSLTSFSFQGVEFIPTQELSGFILKLDLDGNLIWLQPTPIETMSLALDSDHNLYVAGQYQGGFSLGDITARPSPEGDLFITKMNPSGEAQWLHTIGGEETDFVGLVAVGPADEIYFAAELPSRNILFNGDSYASLTDANGDIFMMKFDTEGNQAWQNVFGEAPEGFEINRYYTWPTSMEIAYTGDIILNGFVGEDNFFGGERLTSPYRYNNFVSVISPSGNVRWAKNIISEGTPLNYNEMEVDENGDIYIGGKVVGDFQFTPDYAGNYNALYIAKYSITGEFKYAKTIGARAGNLGGMALSNPDNLFFSGHLYGNSQLNSNQYTLSNNSAFFSELCFQPELSFENAPASAEQGSSSFFTMEGISANRPLEISVTPTNAATKITQTKNIIQIDWAADFTGQANVQTSFTNGCGTGTASQAVMLEAPNGIEDDLFGGSISVYPNPAKNQLKIELPQVSEEQVTISLVTTNGVVILSQYIEMGQNTSLISLDKLSQGLYLVKISNSKGSTTKRFIKL